MKQEVPLCAWCLGPLHFVCDTCKFHLKSSVCRTGNEWTYWLYVYPVHIPHDFRHATKPLLSSHLISYHMNAKLSVTSYKLQREGKKAKTQKKSTFECARAGGRREQAIQQCTILLFLPQEHTDDSQKWDANSLLPNLDHLAQTHKIKKNQTSNVWKNRLKGISTNQRSQMWSPVPGRWNHTTEQTGHSLDSRQLGKKGLSLGRQ